MRLLGGVHALVLAGRASWDDLDAALASPALPRLARRPVQTNGVRRSWTLLPCFLGVTTDEGALRPRSFVWPGQPGRMETLDLAIDAVRREAPRLERGDPG